MFSTGSNAIIAKKMGEGKQEEANRLMSGVAITATVISVIMLCCSQFCRTYVHDVRLKRKNSPLLHWLRQRYDSVWLCNVLADAQPIVPCNSRQATYHACFLDTVGLHKHCAWHSFYGCVGFWNNRCRTRHNHRNGCGCNSAFALFQQKQTLHFGKPEFKVSEILFAMANGSSEAVTIFQQPWQQRCSTFRWCTLQAQKALRL